MFSLTTVTDRRRQPEIMDGPDLDSHRHLLALRGLERINTWSGSAGILWRQIARLAPRMSGRPLRLLDLATGAGDIPIRLWQNSRRAGLSIQIAGCDRSLRALGCARNRAEQKQAEVHFFACDVLREALPHDHDILTCSLYLHHLEEEQAVELLRRMAQAAGRLVLVNDLVRSRVGLGLAYLATRLLTSSDVVHTDGPRSVEGAFTLEEVRNLAVRAGMAEAMVVKRWPCRFLLSWERS